MRCTSKILIYVVAAAASTIILVMDDVTPSPRTRMSASALAQTESAAGVNIVDRSLKGDQLTRARVDVDRGGIITPSTKPSVPLGCDPAYSALAGFSEHNFSALCLAGRANRTKLAVAYDSYS
jgi:hypothetical protein